MNETKHQQMERIYRGVKREVMRMKSQTKFVSTDLTGISSGRVRRKILKRLREDGLITIAGVKTLGGQIKTAYHRGEGGEWRKVYAVV